MIKVIVILEISMRWLCYNISTIFYGKSQIGTSNYIELIIIVQIVSIILYFSYT